MGPYCRYCDMRCFLPRVLRTGESVILATCPAGMDNDLARTGQTHATAANPVTEQELVSWIAVNPEQLTPADFCPFCTHHSNAHVYSAGADDVPCVGCKGGLCRQPPSTPRPEPDIAQLREEAVKVLAAGLDIPPELLTSTARPDPETRTCRRCTATITLIAGEWVVTDTGTSGDGLSYCPPDPDAARHGKHQPAVVVGR